MATIRQNFGQYLKSLQIVYFGLLAGQLIGLTVFYLLPPQKGDVLPDDGMTIRIPMLVLVLLATGYFLGRYRILAAREQTGIKAKMSAYRVAFILRCALLEGGVLLAGIFFFTSRYLLLLAVAVAGLGIFLLFIPTRDRIVNDLDLSASEQVLLDDPNVIVAEYEERTH